MAKIKKTKSVENRKAFHRYLVLEKWEAGICLIGPEVKSIRVGNVSLAESYIRAEKGELFVFGMHVKPYEYAQNMPDPIRTRKLLLKKAELEKLYGKMSKKGLTCVPLRLYINSRGLVKIEIALCQGKDLHDKRQDVKKKEGLREIARERKRYGSAS